MSRVDDLRADYDLLGRMLAECEPGSGAAALVRERRIVGELLEALESSEEVSLVDELDAQRRARTGAAGPSTRGRKSRRGA